MAKNDYAKRVIVFVYSKFLYEVQPEERVHRTIAINRLLVLFKVAPLLWHESHSAFGPRHCQSLTRVPAGPCNCAHNQYQTR